MDRNKSQQTPILRTGKNANIFYIFYVEFTVLGTGVPIKSNWTILLQIFRKHTQ